VAGINARMCVPAIVWDGHTGIEFAEGIDLYQLEHWQCSGVTNLSVNVRTTLRLSTATW
jgi:hypothetical protein